MKPNELLLSVLDDEAWEFAPRLFAVYAVRHESQVVLGNRAFLAFGMEFDEPRKAIMWQPGVTWHAESAADLLERQRMFGEARLVWLHRPDRPEQGDYDLASE